MVIPKPLYHLFDKKTKALHLTSDDQEFSRWFLDIDNRTVGKIKRGEHTVSTVCLGMDSSMVNDPPLIFQTMVYKGDWAEIGYRKDYATYTEARKGHKEAVKWLERELA